MYNILNSWGAAQQFLADIYKTWPLITLICLLSLGKDLKALNLINLKITRSDEKQIK